MSLPEAFLRRMQAQLGDSFGAFLASYDRPAYKGLRVNTLKIDRAEFEKISPFSLEPVAWEENGFYITEEKAGRHPYHFAGAYYLQEPSAMSVVPLLDVRAGDRVLDLCAAPGGKSTQIASALRGTGLLVANEINGARARALSQNVERLGVKNAVVVNALPERLKRKFYRYFDKILVDAPCGGEGMFKKNQKEEEENWSEENIRLCAERQKDILSAASEMLAGGGRMVYSTCTFAVEEDEEQIARFLHTHPDFFCIQQKKLYPHEVRGEGHFYAVLQRADGAKSELPFRKTEITGKDKQAFSAFCDSALTAMPQGIAYRTGDTLYLLPETVCDLSDLPLLRAGVRAGEFVKDRFEPSHALAVCLHKEQAQRTVDLTAAEAEKYLRGETLAAEVGNGWCLITVDGISLGWGKAVNGQVKNHYPKGLRLIK